MLFVLVPVSALCFSAAGCGGGASDAPERYPVSGTVTFDGQPVPEGEIVFIPTSETGRPDAAKIENGAFSLQATAGPKKVQITAYRDAAGKTETGAMGEQLAAREQFLPARYNEQSELTSEIKSGGENTLEFPLVSK
jgi:hypothetical protein